MITLESDTLILQFPEVHKKAIATIEFQRTLRIPDDTKEYPLPPGLGRFPLRHTEDFKDRVPKDWLARGGLLMPLHRAEAMWIRFDNRADAYPFAIKVATGKINALSGKRWSPELSSHACDYLVTPTQPWLDGYCTSKDVVRQFVAMPLGQGYSAEEQITGKAEWGGLQIIAYPMKAVHYDRIVRERREQERREQERRRREAVLVGAAAARCAGLPRAARHSKRPGAPANAKAAVQASYSKGRAYGVEVIRQERRERVPEPQPVPAVPVAMGIGAGGRMRQEIYADPYGLDAWEQTASSRCFVTMVDATDWPRLTGSDAPTRPPTAADYAEVGLPWFDYAGTGETLPGAPELTMLKSVSEVAEEKGHDPIGGNGSVEASPVTELGPKPGASLPQPRLKTGS